MGEKLILKLYVLFQYKNIFNECIASHDYFCRRQNIFLIKKYSKIFVFIKIYEVCSNTTLLHPNCTWDMKIIHLCQTHIRTPKYFVCCLRDWFKTILSLFFRCGLEYIASSSWISIPKIS